MFVFVFVLFEKRTRQMKKNRNIRVEINRFHSTNAESSENLHKMKWNAQKMLQITYKLIVNSKRKKLITYKLIYN